MATTRPRLDAVAAVAAGGAVGTLARHAVATHVGPVDGVPVGVLGVNVLGALLLGLLTATASSTRLRMFLGTGVLGGFTTYSAFALDTQALLTGPTPDAGVVYLLATVAGGFAASVAGLALGARLRRSRAA
jgi:CrcB protein